MTDWDGFRYVLALARHGTLKAAARELGVDQTTVGRRITALEERLGTRLFDKRSDGYLLTLAGERALPTLRNTEDGILSVERIIAGRDERVDGVVRMAMPGALANHWLIPRLKPLALKHPRLELELLTGAEVVNLARREADLALRLVRPTQKDMITKKVGHIELALYAHPSLFQAGKKPAKKEDLKSFPFVGLFPHATSELESSLLEKIGPYLNCSLRSAAWSSVFSAVQAGLGVGILPGFVAERDPRLLRLPFLEPATAPLWLVVHPDLVKSARVRAVVDHLVASFK